MAISYRKVGLITIMTLLAGCAQNRAVPELQNQLVEMNQMISILTDQASALERQNQLNKNSTNGVYLLPVANNAAKLQTSIGELSVSLTHVKAEANGAKAMLHIRILSTQYLAPFTATVEWGQVDQATGQPLPATALSQTIHSVESLLPQTEQNFELRLSGVTPEQLGYLRLHSVTPK
jgi:TolA-binding protein